MPKNYNIQTRSFGITVGSVVAVGSSVAAGMQRYVTFIAVTPRVGHMGKGRALFFCSTTASNTATTLTLASAAAKLKYVQISASADPNAHFPRKINSEAPLFSVAASKFLSVYQSSAQAGSGACSVFVQYYDQ